MIFKVYLTTPKKFSILSKTIRWIQGVNFSHCAIATETDLVVEASTHGVRMITLKSFLERVDIQQTYVISIDTTWTKVFDWFSEILGTRYGFWQVLGLLLISLKIMRTNIFGRGTKRLVCSEVVILFLARFAGYTLKNSDDYDLIKIEKVLNVYGVKYVSNT